MRIMEYVIFAPPINLAAKLPREWSKSEAETYFGWFLSVLEPRVDNMLNFLDLNGDQEESVLLSKAQEKSEQLLTTEEFTSALPAGRKLTNHGYALAADLGLLVARLLIIRSEGKVAWTILKKPKTDQSYNLPVLTGVGGIHLDPVAGSIGDLGWLARGNKKPDAWLRVLEFWSAKIA
jgi:hypothetical protein